MEYDFAKKYSGVNFCQKKSCVKFCTESLFCISIESANNWILSQAVAHNLKADNILVDFLIIVHIEFVVNRGLNTAL